MRARPTAGNEDICCGCPCGRPCQARNKGKQLRSMNRRTFLQTATLGAISLAGTSWARAAAAEKKTSWPIGCFNRAWSKWSYDDALEGIAAAGYKLTGLLSGHRGEAFTSSAATPEYLA